MNEFQEYVLCDICGQLVDAAVPKNLCPFCSIPGAPSRQWVKPVAGVTLGLFVAGGWDHDKGELIPKDLPYEQKHIEQVSTSASALSGWGQLSVMQVSTTATGTISNSTSAGFSQWPKV